MAVLKLANYLFAEPQNGPRLAWLAVFFAITFLIGLSSWFASHRSEYLAVRRRARRLRSIALWAALPGALYIQARYHHVTFIDLRVWGTLIVGLFAIRLTLWSISLRRLAHDKVDERQARRKQTYFRHSRSRKPSKRRRRR